MSSWWSHYVDALEARGTAHVTAGCAKPATLTLTCQEVTAPGAVDQTGRWLQLASMARLRTFLVDTYQQPHGQTGVPLRVESIVNLHCADRCGAADGRRHPVGHQPSSATDALGAVQPTLSGRSRKFRYL